MGGFLECKQSFNYTQVTKTPEFPDPLFYVSPSLSVVHLPYSVDVYCRKVKSELVKYSINLKLLQFLFIFYVKYNYYFYSNSISFENR